MQIQVNTDNQIPADESLTRRVRQIAEAELARFVDRLTRLEVHIGDENSRLKTGGDDKRCSIEARAAGLKPVSATHRAPTVELAVSGATEKLAAALDRRIGRLSEPRNRTLNT